METLTSSTSNLFSNNNYRYRDKGFSVVHSRLEIRFLPSPKHVAFSLFRSISLQPNSLLLFQPILASSLSSSDPQAHWQDDETQIEDQSKTVRVKFQLERECSFGEQFHIVGNDPVLGLWDPSSAIPLDWSDGHTWTVELDMPIEKPIHFKFILKEKSGNILWQPGPDRILLTWETENTICVSEDWDSAEFQKVIEEELAFSQNESIPESADTPMAIIAENIAYLEERTHEKTNNEVFGTRKVTSTNEQDDAVSADTPMAIIAENIAYPEEKTHEKTNNEVFGTRKVTSTNEQNDAVSERDFGNNGKAVSVKNTVFDEGAPVLVLGLTPLLTTDNKEASPKEDEENTIADASLGHGKTKEHNVPEIDLKEKPESDSPHLKEAAEMIHNDEKEVSGYEHGEKSLLARAQDLGNSTPFENDVVENDVQWGRKTLQKFLANLGLL